MTRLRAMSTEDLRDKKDALKPTADAYRLKTSAGQEVTKNETMAAAIYEAILRELRRRQQDPDTGLLEFIRYFWKVLEPVDPFFEGWALDCLCTHLQAITQGKTIVLNGVERKFNRLLANVPPGFMKSLATNVFWPAHEWGPCGMPHLRYVCFSYNSDLTERDNAKFRDLVCSAEYKELWGHVFRVIGDPKAGQVLLKNDKTGFKRATSFGGTGTGERGHRVILDDPHKLKGTAETDEARKNVTEWVLNAMQNRLNDLSRDAIVVIMQRVHEADTSGEIMENLADDYCHLVIPMAYEGNRHFSHYLGWNDGMDPRTEEGELAWPERYPPLALKSFMKNAQLWAGQYQQNPTPKGGGIFKEDWWQMFEVQPDGSYVLPARPLYVLASLDTAFKEKEENDYSALTVWVVYEEPVTRLRRLLMVDAWRKKLPLHGIRTFRQEGEDEKTYLRRASKDWGLCEWVAWTCNQKGVDRLIIEDSARGHDVNNEIRRVFGDRTWGVDLVPARSEKWARAHSVVDLFTDEMVYTCGLWNGDMWEWRQWAWDVIYEMVTFPRGKNDDLVDSVVMALRFMRDQGLAIRRDEKTIAEQHMAEWKPKANPKPLYPA